MESKSSTCTCDSVIVGEKKMDSRSATWTVEQNKRFENAIAVMEDGGADQWEKIAKAVGDGKTIEDVKIHYEKLVMDIISIESGAYPLPNYKDDTTNCGRD